MSRFARFDLLEKISGTGLSETWTATAFYADGSSTDVVVKRILADAVDGPMREKLLEDVEEASRLEHGSIAKIHDWGVLDDGCFFATERVFGVDARALLEASPGGLPPRAALHIAASVLRGLDHAHRPRGGSRGCLHREVAPANVLVSMNGDVKLTGFGIANTRARTGRLRDGGPRYASPEQLRGEKLDGRSDVFSAGLLVHELLTGRPVFPPEAADGGDVAIPWPSSVNLGVPVELDELVLRLCEPVLEKRFASGLAAAEAIAEWGIERNLVLREDGLAEHVAAVMPPRPAAPTPRWRVLGDGVLASGRSAYVTDAAFGRRDPDRDARRAAERVTRQSTDPAAAAVFYLDVAEDTNTRPALETVFFEDVPFDPGEITREGTREVVIAPAPVAVPEAPPPAVIDEPPTRTQMSAVVPAPSRVPLIATVLLVAGGLGCSGIAVTAAALWSFLGPTQ